MTTPLSCLQLKHHAFTHVELHATENGSLGGEPVLTPQIQFRKVADPEGTWQLVLRVELGSADPKKPFAYIGNVVIQAELFMLGEFDEATKQELALVNGTGILYGAVRELVLNLTSRSTNGPLSLPVLDFRDTVRALIAAKEKPKGETEKPA